MHFSGLHPHRMAVDRAVPATAVIAAIIVVVKKCPMSFPVSCHGFPQFSIHPWGSHGLRTPLPVLPRTTSVANHTHPPPPATFHHLLVRQVEPRAGNTGKRRGAPRPRPAPALTRCGGPCRPPARVRHPRAQQSCVTLAPSRGASPSRPAEVRHPRAQQKCITLAPSRGASPSRPAEVCHPRAQQRCVTLAPSRGASPSRPAELRHPRAQQRGNVADAGRTRTGRGPHDRIQKKRMWTGRGQCRSSPSLQDKSAPRPRHSVLHRAQLFLPAPIPIPIRIIDRIIGRTRARLPDFPRVARGGATWRSVHCSPLCHFFGATRRVHEARGHRLSQRFLPSNPPSPRGHCSSHEARVQPGGSTFPSKIKPAVAICFV
eukprot:gene13643-biopygen14111